MCSEAYVTRFFYSSVDNSVFEMEIHSDLSDSYDDLDHELNEEINEYMPKREALNAWAKANGVSLVPQS